VEYEDTVTVATPEGVDLELTLAGLGSRFVAGLVDTVLQGLLIAALGLLLIGVEVFTRDPGLGGVGAAVFFVGAFLVWFGYHVFFEVLASGRTPGKRWSGLRVVRAGGYPITFMASAVRNILRLVDMLPGAYVVGCVSILVTRRNQRLGDVAAGTLVVRERKGRESARRQPYPRAVALSPASPEETAGWDVSAITAEELAAVRRFLERRDELERIARDDVGRRLAERLRPKVAGAPNGLAPEAFLERLAAAKAARS
jgi:uncharacterized RDD family membrane protein YckC